MQTMKTNFGTTLCTVAALGFSALLSYALLSSSLAQQPSDPNQSPLLGVWYDDTGRGAVKVEPCGKHLCGRIYWLKDTTTKSGEPLQDQNNPKPELRQQPICGLQVLGQLTAQGDGTWDNGWVYDPKVGRSYNAELRPGPPGELHLRGYKLVKLLGKTLIWKKAPDDLPNCKVPPS